MNKIQTVYALAKAHHDTIKAENDQMETAFCAERGYVTDEGSQALHVWMIDDDAIFEEANAEFCALNERGGQEEIEAREALRKAEDVLLAWGLSVMPRGLAKERETLRRGAEQNFKTREKLIDLAFRLDSRTVSA